VQTGEYDWPHDGLTIATYAIWILLMAGLTIEVQCWRERAFFFLVFANFVMGFVVAVCLARRSTTCVTLESLRPWSGDWLPLLA
jgi:hypothetical protein